MTPTEVLSEIYKMPLVEKRKILVKLSKELSNREPKNLQKKELDFVNSLKRKGLVTEIPLGLSDDKFRRNFKRINIKDEPLSETIIKERG
jgi:hypothetical protein